MTAEGLGTLDALHPVQREMAARGGSQCGYCTPGFVCTMAAEFYRADRASAAARRRRRPRARAQRLRPARHERQPVPLHRLPPDPRRGLGARPAARRRPAGAAGCPPHRRRPSPTRIDRRRRVVRPAAPTSPRRCRCSPSTPTPPSSPAAPTGASRSTSAASGRRTPWRSTGCPSCASSRSATTTILVGAALTLSEVEAGLAGAVPLLDEVWPLFASRLIRNGATIGGNIGTASPIGDLPPALLALEANVVLVLAAGRPRGRRWPTTSPATARPCGVPAS